MTARKKAFFHFQTDFNNTLSSFKLNATERMKEMCPTRVSNNKSPLDGLKSVTENLFDCQQFYVLLPPKYGSVLERDRYCYFYAEMDLENKDNACCTVLDGGVPVPGATMYIPLEELKKYVVKKGESCTSVGETIHRLCAIKVQDKGNEVWKYGQIVRAEWKQHKFYQDSLANTTLHVQLTKDIDYGSTVAAEVVVVSPYEVVLCSKVAFLARPFEGQPSTAFHDEDVSSVHSQLDEFIKLVKPKQFIELYLSIPGNTKAHPTWNTGDSILNKLGQEEEMVLEEVINTYRVYENQSMWTSLVTKTDKCALTFSAPSLTTSTNSAQVSLLPLVAGAITEQVTELREMSKAATKSSSTTSKKPAFEMPEIEMPTFDELMNSENDGTTTEMTTKEMKLCQRAALIERNMTQNNLLVA